MSKAETKRAWRIRGDRVNDGSDAAKKGDTNGR